jgi:hypothetical protein
MDRQIDRSCRVRVYNLYVNVALPACLYDGCFVRLPLCEKAKKCLYIGDMKLITTCISALVGHHTHAPVPLLMGTDNLCFTLAITICATDLFLLQ